MSLRLLDRIRDSLRVLLGRSRFEREMDEELRFHLESQADDLAKQGLSEGEAMRRARAGFGAVEGVKEDARAARGARWADELVGDLRYAFRTLRRSPAYSVVAILTLGLGIGANTTIFSAVNGVLLEPLPFPESERLVRVAQGYGLGAIEIYRREASSYDGVAAYTYGSEFSLFAAGVPERIKGRAVSAEFFSVLGIAAASGRTFRAGEDEPGAAPVAVISYGLWRRRFGADPGVVGRSIAVDGVPREVVGVAPRGFGFPVAGSEMWIPVSLDPKNNGVLWGAGGNTMFGRLKRGVSVAAADAEHRGKIARVRDSYPWRMPDKFGQGPENHVRPLGEVMAEGVRNRLALLLAAVGLVLAVACANVANLNLTRLGSREREIAVRQAIGGTRRRVARQLVVEQLVVAGLGGALGVALAWAGLPLLVRWLPPDTPRLDQVRVDLRVLAFTGAAALGAGILTAIGPLARLPGAGRLEALGGSGRGSSSGPGRGRLAAALVVTEVALAAVLVVGAGVLLRSLRELLSVDPGVRVERLVTARVTPDPSRCDGRAEPCNPSAYVLRVDNQPIDVFFGALERELAAIPGVSAVAFASSVPLDDRQAWFVMEVEDHPVPPGSPAHELAYHIVTPSYFEVVGIGIEEGRGFTPEDRENSERVVVVSRALASRFWPGGSPIGKHIRPLWVTPWSRIVGVVSDARYDGLGKAEPSLDYYMPLTQPEWTGGSMTIAARTGLTAEALEPAIKRAVAAVDPTAPVNQVQSMAEVVRRSTASPRTTTGLIGLFALVALALGSIGVFGVLSYGVSQRRREIGIRMAIGAEPATVMMMVVKRAAGLVAAGLAVGLLAAWTGASLLSGFVFGVSVRDPVTYALVPMIFAVVGLIAAYVPARRASRVSPTETLKEG